MSLITDALKRVEKSLNDNSADQKLNQPMPPFLPESSGGNKKLFYIALIGGTLFFSILILLLVLIFSPSPSAKTSSNITPPPTPNTSNIAISTNGSNEEKNLPSEEPAIIPTIPSTPSNEFQEETIPEENFPTENRIDTTAVELQKEPFQNAGLEETNAKESLAASSTSANTNDTANKKAKDLNQELFEGVVGLASKAFTSNPNKPKPSNSSSTNSENAEATENTKENQKPAEENYTLSTAQATLENIQRESQAAGETPKIPETPKTKMQQYIDSLWVTGVMISQDESMALINNRVFTKGAVIDATFNLTLVDVQPQKIVLQDSSGTLYDVNF